MDKIRIGVLCPSEIAFRRFMPALQKTGCFEFAGIASAGVSEWSGKASDELVRTEREKARKFTQMYGGRLFASYGELLGASDVDAIYIPLPPALHYDWARAALECNKHVFLEKPFTTSLQDTEKLILCAKERNLAVHENYMFVYHTQLEWIRNQVSAGTVGEVRLIQIDFGFPFRGVNDFRYCKALGGGALLDCGGYTIKLASILLGETAQIVSAQLNYKEEFEVDICGSAMLVNSNGLTAQVSFGMDNNYRCNLSIWGSEGEIFTNRILTAPDGFEPVAIIKHSNEEEAVSLPADDTFKKSMEYFARCISDTDVRTGHFEEIWRQGMLIDTFERKRLYGTFENH